MHDSRSLDAEHCVQPGFSKFLPLVFLFPPLCVLLFAQALANLPDREEFGKRIAQVEFQPVHANADRFAPLSLAGAWTVWSDDPRVGGISGLAIDRGRLLALSDAGVLIRLPKPAGRQALALVAELPSGPRSRAFKRNRDSEAIVRDPLGRGWWVAFETHHELWLYDPTLERALLRIELGSNRWRENTGIEAIAAQGSQLLLFPETGREFVRIRAARAEQRSLIGRTARISESATLPGGDLVLVERAMTWRGFANSLLVLKRQADTYRIALRLVLPLGPLDNVEALAAETLGDGTLRLWLMTDDNLQRPFRTLLVALDVPPGALVGP